MVAVQTNARMPPLHAMCSTATNHPDDMRRIVSQMRSSVPAGVAGALAVSQAVCQLLSLHHCSCWDPLLCSACSCTVDAAGNELS